MLKERCLKAQPKKKQLWYLDSGCSRHMTGDESLFQELDRKKSGNVSFAPRKGVIANDNADFEDHIVEEPKEKSKKIAKKIHPWNICKERKINMMISPRLGNMLEIIP